MRFFQQLLTSGSGTITSVTPTNSAEYSAESLATFAYFTGADELNIAEKNAIDRFIKGQVFSGNWSKIKSLQLLCGLTTDRKALIELKSGTIGTNVGASYNSVSGFTTDGISSYVNTNIIPSELLTLNNAGVYIYPIEPTTIVSIGAISSSSNTNQLAVTYTASSKSVASKVSNGATASSVLADAYPKNKVLIGGVREDSTRSYVLYGSDVVVSSISTSTGLPNVVMYVGAQNYNGATSFGAANYGTFALFEAVDFNHGSFNFYLEQLMVELGVSNADSLYNVIDAPSYNSTDALLLNAEGQSNSLYAGKPTTLKYTELQNPIIGANMFYMNPLGATPIMGDLEYLVNHTNDAEASGYANFGGGLRLSKELTNQDLKYYIWAYGKSGTRLYADNGKDWNATSTNEFLYETNEYLGSNIIPTITEPIKKLVWHWNQGEGDGGRTTQQYTDDFYALLDAKINFYESKGINLGSTDFHVIITQIWEGLEANYVGSVNIVNAQRAFSKSNFELAYPTHVGKIKTFVVYNNDKSYHIDGVHVGSEGLHVEGYRLANYISKL